MDPMSILFPVLSVGGMEHFRRLALGRCELSFQG